MKVPCYREHLHCSYLNIASVVVHPGTTDMTWLQSIGSLESTTVVANKWIIACASCCAVLMRAHLSLIRANVWLGMCYVAVLFEPGLSTCHTPMRSQTIRHDILECRQRDRTVRLAHFSNLLIFHSSLAQRSAA